MLILGDNIFHAYLEVVRCQQEDRADAAFLVEEKVAWDEADPHGICDTNKFGETPTSSRSPMIRRIS